ncbi:MAG: hypothetical protein EP307_03785 [Rhodobacteraceae bacterium]|nr:MAG: hypothetical protein EP307_03785 [Paracoccaceae bacterium]
MPGLAAADLDVEASGVLSDIRVGKTGLVGGASADLEFDLDYLIRVSALMGAPIVNCGLRVRDLTGTARMTIRGQQRTVPIGPDNEAGVSILHLGFVLHNNAVLMDGGVSSLSFRCQPGVIARGDSQPFNVASNPGLGNFFCANARMPLIGARNDLPDMLGPDWCADLGGSPVPAETARALIADGVLDSIGYFAFPPIVVALGIGIGDLVAAEREVVAALEETEEEGKPDPARAAIERLVAERAKGAAAAEPQDAAAAEPVATAAPTNPAQTTLARLAADRLRAQEAPAAAAATSQPAAATPGLGATPAHVAEKPTPLFKVDRSKMIVEIATGTRIGKLPWGYTLIDGVYLIDVGQFGTRHDCAGGKVGIPALDPRTLTEVNRFEFPCAGGFGQILSWRQGTDEQPMEFRLRVFDGARREMDPGPEPAPCTGLKFMKTAEIDGRAYRLDASLTVIEDLGPVKHAEGRHAGDALCLHAVPSTPRD